MSVNPTNPPTAGPPPEWLAPNQFAAPSQGSHLFRPNFSPTAPAPAPEPEPETTESSDPWLQQRLNYIASIAPPPSPSSSSGGVS
jgi:hypothetical protein